MATEAKTRLEILREVCRQRDFVKPDGKSPSPSKLAAAIDRKTNYTSDLLLGRRSFGEEVARHIEDKLRLPRWHLDGGESRGFDPKSDPAPAASARQLESVGQQLATSIGRMVSLDSTTRDAVSALLAGMLRAPARAHLFAAQIDALVGAEQPDDLPTLPGTVYGDPPENARPSRLPHDASSEKSEWTEKLYGDDLPTNRPTTSRPRAAPAKRRKK